MPYGVGFTHLNYASATIDCRGPANEQLLVVFAATQAQADAGGNFTNLANKRGGVVAAMTSFPAYFDLLRNEGPIYDAAATTVPAPTLKPSGCSLRERLAPP